MNEEGAAAIDLDRLADWLGRQVGAETCDIVDTSTFPENGASNITMRFDARWRGAGGGSGSFVVRVGPEGSGLYHSYELSLQYRVMEALASSKVPVPPLVGYEAEPSWLGRPFYVMRTVEGIAPQDLPPFTVEGWLLEAPVDEQERLYRHSVDMIARIHQVPVDDGRFGFLNQTDAETGLRDQFDRTVTWYRWAIGERQTPEVLERTLGWLVENFPSNPPPEGLNWGDARMGNMLYRDQVPVAVLDWEFAALGPGEVDLGWFLFMNRHHSRGIGVPWLEGFPDDEGTVALYESALGRPTRDLFWYEVLGGFRFGIIMMRMIGMLIEDGRAPAEVDADRNNSCTRLLAEMLKLFPN